MTKCLRYLLKPMNISFSQPMHVHCIEVYANNIGGAYDGMFRQEDLSTGRSLILTNK